MTVEQVLHVAESLPDVPDDHLGVPDAVFSVISELAAYDHFRQRVVLIDDLLATGGTMLATANLLRKVGAEVAGMGFLIELAFLNGRQKLAGYPVFSLAEYQD